MNTSTGHSVWRSTAAGIVLLANFTLLGILLLFQNCSQVDFTPLSQTSGGSKESAPGTQSGAPADPQTQTEISGQIPPAETEVVATCGRQAQQATVVRIEIPARTTNCEWGENGNLSRLNGYFRARSEQIAAFSLPANTLMCGISMNFPGQQNFVFDDHFLLNLDDAVLASSYKFSQFLAPNPGQPYQLFDWSLIRGQPWVDCNTGQGMEGQFCVGKELGLSQCSWPVTEQFGQVKIEIDPQVIQKITALNPNRSSHQFNFVTVGDNDSTDCKHPGFYFDLQIQYVQKNQPAAN